MIIKEMSFWFHLLLVIIVNNLLLPYSIVAMENNTSIARASMVFGHGTVTGPACIVTNVDQYKNIQPGDIVVTPTVNQILNNAVQKNVAGIIIEKASFDTHCIELIKKLNKPVLLGVIDATKKISDGATISFNSSSR